MIHARDELGSPVRLNIRAVNSYVERLKYQQGGEVIEIARPFGEPVYMIHLASPNQKSAQPRMRVLLTAGVHGNEPLGVTAALQVTESFITSPRLRSEFDLTVIPMIN